MPSRLLVVILGALLLMLQYTLWFGHTGARALWDLHREIAAQKAENQRLRERNQAIVADVQDLRGGLEAAEERARYELGMIKRNETFFHIIEPSARLDPG